MVWWGFFYIRPSGGLRCWDRKYGCLLVYCFACAFSPLFPFAYVFFAWENMGFDHFLFISLPSIFPSSFFSCLHHFLLISGSTFISPMLLLPPRAIVW